MNPYHDYNKMKELLHNKANGIDCSEEESAEIKGFLRETMDKDDFSTNMIRTGIVHYFPLEYAEVAEELETK